MSQQNGQYEEFNGADQRSLTTQDLPPQSGALVAIAQSREVQEIRASLQIAKMFPRDTIRALNSILEACKRPSFAKIATYSYKRGGAVVSGGSVRLAELMAQNYQNIDFGVRELDQREGVSTCEAFCFDKENNSRQVRAFQVMHKFKANGAMKELTDNRDIYEYVANQGARRMRACIFAIIPFDFTEAALAQIKQTLAGDLSKKPLVDSIREMALLFKSHFQVTQEMLEKYLGHPMAETTVEKLVELQGIANSLRDKQSKREEWFGGAPAETPASPLAAKLKNQKAEKEAAPETKEEVKPEKTQLQVAAGNLTYQFWKDHPPVKIATIPEGELIEMLTALETQSHNSKLPKADTDFYNSACTFLNKQRNLKTS